MSLEAGAVEPHTCKNTQDNTVMLGFVMYDTEGITAKYYSDNIVEVQKEFMLRPRTALHAVHSAVWIKQIDCVGHAARNGNLFLTFGLNGTKLTGRTTNQRSDKECWSKEVSTSSGMHCSHGF